MKNTFKKWLSSKPIKYVAEQKAPMSMMPGQKAPTRAFEPMRPIKPRKKRIAPSSNMRSYGQPGYRPSSGRGVGH